MDKEVRGILRFFVAPRRTSPPSVWLSFTNILIHKYLHLSTELSLAGTNWTADYAGCGGQYQSPINLDSDTALPADFREFNLN